MSTSLSYDIVVVDTDVISFLFKGNTLGTLYEPHLVGSLQIIAAQSRAELERWTLLHNWGPRRRSELHLYLEKYVFAEVDEAICMRWAEIKVEAQRIGRPISVTDAWIAATAIAYTVPLVTHNRRDFESVPGLTVISES